MNRVSLFPSPYSAVQRGGLALVGSLPKLMHIHKVSQRLVVVVGRGGGEAGAEEDPVFLVGIVSAHKMTPATTPT